MAKRRNSSSRRAKKQSSLLKVLLVLVLIILAISFSFNSLVLWGVERYARNQLGIDLSIGSLNVSIFTGNVTARNIVLPNPKGYDDPKLLSVGLMDVDVQGASIFSETIIIKRLHLDEVEMYYALSEKGSNFQRFINNLNKAEENPPPTAKPPSKTRQVILRDVLVTHAVVFPSLQIATEKRGAKIELADMRFQDVGGEGQKITPADAMEFVVKTLLRNITMQLPSSMIEQGLGNMKKGIKEIGDGLFK